LFLCVLMTFVGRELSVWLVTFWSDWVVNLTFLTLTVSHCDSYSDVSRTVRALTRGKLPEARKLAGTFHFGNADLLDDHGICRAIANHFAGEFRRWLLGPVFWYLLLRLPGLLLYAAIIAVGRMRMRRGLDLVGWQIV
jgi:adenosylcobinamide-phosphate synthase